MSSCLNLNHIQSKQLEVFLIKLVLLYLLTNEFYEVLYIVPNLYLYIKFMVIGRFAEKPDRVECQRLCVFTPVCTRLSHTTKENGIYFAFKIRGFWLVLSWSEFWRRDRFHGNGHNLCILHFFCFRKLSRVVEGKIGHRFLDYMTLSQLGYSSVRALPPC